MTRELFVSVIIPAYYSDAVIDGCLASLDRQTYRHFEVIVVNSSPETRTRQVVENAYPETIFIQHRERLYPQDAKSLAVARAGGDFLAFVDPDCRAHPDWLRVLVNECEQGRDFVGGSLDNHCHTWLEGGIHLCKFHDVLCGVRAGPIWIIPFSNAGMKRETWDAIGPFKPNLFCSDALLSLHAREQGYTPWFEPKAVVEHIHGLTLPAFLRQRYVRGKEFAVERIAHEQWSTVRTLTTLLLTPFIILQVLAKSAIHAAKSGKGLLFISTWPVQVLGQSAWIAGEALGFTRTLRAGLLNRERTQ